MTKVAFRSRDERVLPEMSAKVLFLSEEPKQTQNANIPLLTIPLSSVVERNGRKVVLTVADGAIVETAVALGEAMADRIVVREGLTAGDRIVARPDPSLAHGTHVVLKK